LIGQPFVQLLHQWRAVLLVQTLLGIQALLSRQRMVAVHHPERFQHILALLWEVGGYMHELASQTILGISLLSRRRGSSRGGGWDHGFRRGANVPPFVEFSCKFSVLVMKGVVERQPENIDAIVYYIFIENRQQM
jgi:hypothetical protein